MAIAWWFAPRVGDAKAQMKKGDNYQDVVAVLRVAEMIVAHAWDEPAPVAIITESAEHGGWDDIVEIFPKDARGSEPHEAWQVKRGALDGDELVRLLRDLTRQSKIRRAVIGLREHVDVVVMPSGPGTSSGRNSKQRKKRIGSTRALASLCEEAQKSGGDLSRIARTKEQRSFVQFVRDATSIGRDDDLVDLLGRLRIEFLGSEDDVGTTIRRRLALLYRAPVDGIFDALKRLIDEHNGARRIDIDLVEHAVLHRFAKQRLATPRSTREARARWLEHVEKSALERGVLAGVAYGPSLRLADVWIDTLPAADREQKVLTHPLHERMVAASGLYRCVVLGDAGSGKTEMLRRTAAALARRARQDPAVPIPLFMYARDLGRGVETALREAWAPAEEDALHLWRARDTRFIVLVDGLDEAGAEAISRIEALERELGERLAGIAVASRPVLQFKHLRAEEVWVGRWNHEQAERFLDLWAAREPKAVAALRASPHRKGIAELLVQPLTATLCLLVAEREPEALESRASVYRAVVTCLVDDWIQQRGVKAPIAPEDVVRALEEPALQLVRQERAFITETELRRALGRAFENRETSAVAAAEVHLGLLVRRGDRNYDFALRGLAEHLAGRSLARQGPQVVTNAAHSAWGQETVRHAIGWAEERERGQGSAFLRALLKHEGNDNIVMNNRHLRAVLVAIRAAGDLEQLDEVTSDQLTRAAWRRLIDETSLWVGEHVADAVNDWQRTRRGSCARIRDRALEVICDVRRSPAAWYAAQSWDAPRAWSQLLYHRDSTVRGVAVEKLSRWVDDSTVRTMLFFALLDCGIEPGSRPVAMEAGLALRKAARDKDFKARLTQIRIFLRSGQQFQRAGAALALRPGEADVQELAFGLHHGLMGSGFGVPREVLEALAAADGGRAALDRWAPDWKTTRHELPRPEGGTEGEVPPVSWTVRRRILRAVSSVLHRVSGDVLLQIHDANRMALMDEACDIAEDFPESIVALLDAAPAKPLNFFWDHSPLALGRAVVRHTEVRRALVALWHRLAEMVSPGPMSPSDYPGRALEPLIHRGDLEAIRIYTEWLKCAHLHGIPQSFQEPLLLGAEVPDEIRRAGRERAEQIWKWMTVEQPGTNGQPTRGHPGAGGAALFRLSMFWRDDEAFCQRIEGWLETEDFDAALWALQAVPLRRETRARIVNRATEILVNEGLEGFEQQRWWTLLHVIERANLVHDFLELLAPLSDPECPVAMLATALRLPFCGEEDRYLLSARIAEAPYCVDPLAPHLAERLVQAAPGPWATALARLLEDSWISGSRSWIPFVLALPLVERRRVADAWVRSAMELPWSPEGDLMSRCVRPADRAMEMLFNLGIEREGEAIDREAMK